MNFRCLVILKCPVLRIGQFHQHDDCICLLWYHISSDHWQSNGRVKLSPADPMGVKNFHFSCKGNWEQKTQRDTYAPIVYHLHTVHKTDTKYRILNYTEKNPTVYSEIPSWLWFSTVWRYFLQQQHKAFNDCTTVYYLDRRNPLSSGKGSERKKSDCVQVLN